MGTKTKKTKRKTKQTSRQTTKFEPIPLGTPAFFGKQKELFTGVGDILSKRLKDPLTAPGFAAGRDFLSRRTESLKRGARGAPNIFAGLREGALRDIESTETRALSDLIFQIRQGAERNALAFATRPIQRGGVAATSVKGDVSTVGKTSTPGVTFGEQLGQVGMSTLGSFGQSFGAELGSRSAGRLLPSPLSPPSSPGASGAF